jgi:putative ATP-grasp target RiPP
LTSAAARNTGTTDWKDPRMLTEHHDPFPLDANSTFTDSPQAIGGIVPFGLRFAMKPAMTVDVDFPAISYDPDRQIAVVADGDVTVPAMKHTSTQTKTTTASQDRKGNDSDSDSTGK